MNPIQVADDWAFMSDGSVAVIRGRDYHVDWIAPDGQRSSSPKLPFQWRRLSDSDKIAIVDSARRTAAAHPTSFRPALADQSGQLGPAIPIVDSVVGPEELPDYVAPFAGGTSMADADNHLWLLPTRDVPVGPAPGPRVYDVVDREGLVIDHIQILAGQTVVGFGTNGIVYLTSREAKGTVLVRTRAR